jgi:hypothetical protein
LNKFPAIELFGFFVIERLDHCKHTKSCYLIR